jgi:predicted DNA-binding protein
MKANKDDSVTFRVRKTLKDRIEFVAQLEERSVSQTIGRTIERWVSEAEDHYQDNGSVWAIIEELRDKDSGFQEVRPAMKPAGKPSKRKDGSSR